MTESDTDADDIVAVSGDDAVIWNGYSEEWTKMILTNYQSGRR